MKKPRPLTTDITFCQPVDTDSIQNQTTRQQCRSCARNTLRYDLSGLGLLSFFASPILKPNKPCDYYLHDDRPEEGATPTTKNSEKCAKETK